MEKSEVHVKTEGIGLAGNPSPSGNQLKNTSKIFDGLDSDGRFLTDLSIPPSYDVLERLSWEETSKAYNNTITCNRFLTVTRKFLGNFLEIFSLKKEEASDKH